MPFYNALHVKILRATKFYLFCLCLLTHCCFYLYRRAKRLSELRSSVRVLNKMSSLPTTSPSRTRRWWYDEDEESLKKKSASLPDHSELPPDADQAQLNEPQTGGVTDVCYVIFFVICYFAMQISAANNTAFHFIHSHSQL